MISLLVLLIIIGVALYFIPMDNTIKQFAIAIVIIYILLALLGVAPRFKW